MTDHLSRNFLAQAQIIGDKLCRAACWSGTSCYWVDEVNEIEDGVTKRTRQPVGSDLYSGTSGIALFLARLYQITANDDYRRTAEGAVEYALSNADDTYIGLYAGYAGTGYAALQVGELLGTKRFVEPATRIVDSLHDSDLDEQPPDVTFGAAGVIPFLLDFSRRQAQESALSLALKYGDHLINVARKSDAGISWNSIYEANDDPAFDLTGFSHGASGMGWALLELGNFVDEKRFLKAAEEAFRFEQNRFHAERENWPDLRSFIESNARYPVAWCHGAPGVGFVRLRAYELTGQQVYRKEAEAALRTTARMLALPNKRHNYSLCHGIAGNSDLLVYASQILEDVSYLETAREKGLQGIEEIEKQRLPWPCGSLDWSETAGLMQGLAGIGYFYLRLHDPVMTPPITIILPQ